MSWSSYKQRANGNSGSGGGKYVRLKDDGAKAKVVVMGDPMERWAFRRPDGTVGNGSETDAKGHADHWVSYMLPVYDAEHKIPAILDMSPGLFKDLCSFFEDFDQQRVVLIKRVGVGKNTSWQVNNLAELTAEQRAVIAREQPYDLRAEGCTPIPVAGAASKPAAKPSPTPPPAEQADEDIPF